MEEEGLSSSDQNNKIFYPNIHFEHHQPPFFFFPKVDGGIEKDEKEKNIIRPINLVKICEEDSEDGGIEKDEKEKSIIPPTNLDNRCVEKDEKEKNIVSPTISDYVEEDEQEKQIVGPTNLLNQENDLVADGDCKTQEGKYFSYESPISEDTGVWIPVSVLPMSETVREEWNKGLCLNGAHYHDCDESWDQVIGEEKEMTMWDVVLDMLLVAQGKVTSLASGDIHGYAISWMSDHLLERAWEEMSQTLTEANFGNTREIIEAEPPKWLADSAASACMLCNVRFHPIMCSRHHCRFCGGIFCNQCSKGRSLLPIKFRTGNPQRVCDVCYVKIESVQPYLIDQVSRASQLPTRDLTDLSTLRSWLNFPWGQSMEHEIYKATNAIRGYIRVGSLKPEKSIPESVLKQAKGLAILTIAKVGMMVTYNIGTGLVVARRADGSWSPPSAISTCGVGWGAQAGGEVTEFIIVLRNSKAVKTFGGNMHFSIGAGLSAAVGVVGRAAVADLRAGDGGYAACYAYSCSKGAFVGCSLEGSVVTTRTQENSRFYGTSSVKASDILLGLMPRPPAAAILYHALSDLYRRVESHDW